MKYLDYIDTWLKYKESEYSFSTLKTYKGLINKHFRPFFKDRQIEDLTRDVYKRQLYLSAEYIQ